MTEFKVNHNDDDAKWKNYLNEHEDKQSEDFKDVKRQHQ